MPDPDPACNPIVFVMVALIFLLCNILLSLSDEAFKAITDNRIRELEEDGDRKIGRVRRLLENERRFTNRVRLGTWINGSLAIASVLYAFWTPLSRQLAIWFYPTAEKGWQTPLTDILSALAVILLCTVVFAVFSSRLSRRIALKNPESIAKFTSATFILLFTLLAPLDWLCNILTYPFLRLSGINPKDNPDQVTEEDILELMDAVEESGAIEEAQADMVNNILEFDDITAAEIMTPRIDVSAVEIETPLHEALRVCIDDGYSRIPVFEEDIDHIVGLLYIKDLLPYVGQPIPEGLTIRHLLRETHFVPDTKKCDDLFEEMTEKHLQMSIVVDEYGGVAGIVTMEDLLESIVGSIQDEFDNEEDEVTQLDDHSFEIDGSLSIGELEELLDMEISDRDYDTVAGFVMDQLGYIPAQAERAVVHYGNIDYTVQEMDDRRIEQVLVHINPEVKRPEPETED